MAAHAKEVAKILVSDWVCGDLPQPIFNPLSVEPESGGRPVNLLALACRAHKEDCEKLGTHVPLVLTVPQIHLKEAESYVSGVKRQTAGYEVLLTPEMQVPGMTLTGEELTPGPDSQEYLIGGGVSLRAMAQSLVLRDLWQRGIRWLLIGEMRNMGCRITDDFLELLGEQSEDGSVECMPRDAANESNVLLLERPASTSHRGEYMCVHERRTRGRENALRSLVEESTLACTGSFWVSCKSLARAMKLHPDKYFSMDLQAVPDADYTPEKEEGLLHFSNGLLVLTFPVYDIMMHLDLAPIEVPRTRLLRWEALR